MDPKRPIVFVHGDLQNKTIFYGLSTFFRNKGHETLLIDLPGHGLERINDDNKDLALFLHNKTKKFAEPIFVTNSSGSVFVAQMIQRFGGCSRICMINPLLTSLKLSYPGANIEALRKIYLDKSRNSFQSQTLFDYSTFKGGKDELDRARFSTTDPKGLANNLDICFQLTSKVELSESSIPILLIASSKDEAVPVSYFKDLCKELKNCKYAEVNAGHDALITNQREMLEAFSKNYDFFN